MRVRPFWVIVHRWAGLTIALFLIVAGSTGSLLAFKDELDTLAAPSLHHVESPSQEAALLDPQVLRERVMALYPGCVINYMPLRLELQHSVSLQLDRIDPATGRSVSCSSGWNEIFANPFDGRIIGHRQFGAIGEGMVNIIPFLYQLHFSLALGAWGRLAFGIAALIWTFDCFVGFYLTLPSPQRIDGVRKRRSASQWWPHWQPAWLIRRHGGSHRLVFDLHRASGLWIWPLLLVFAWSAVFFNLTPVYTPLMRGFGYQSLQEGIVPPQAPRYQPKLDFRAAAAIGEELARRESSRLGLTIDVSRDTGLLHRPDAGLYVYVFTSSADMRTVGGRSLAIFDSDTGKLIKFILPQGQNGANSFTEWIAALHTASVWGLPWRLATAVVGLVVTSLATTGVLLWRRKRVARR